LPFVSTLILHTPMLTLFPYTTLFRSCGSKAKSRRFASCILTSWILTVEIPDLCVVGYASPLYDRLRLFLIEVNSMPGVRNRNGNGNLQSLSSLPSLSRGIYKRVAERLVCDPSYVSR